MIPFKVFGEVQTGRGADDSPYAEQSPSIDRQPMLTEMRLRLDLSPNIKAGPLTLNVGNVASVVASVIAEGIDDGTVEIESSTDHVVVVSEAAVPLDSGTYVRQVEWSIGGVSATPEKAPALLEVRARAGRLRQVAQVHVTVVGSV